MIGCATQGWEIKGAYLRGVSTSGRSFQTALLRRLKVQIIGRIITSIRIADSFFRLLDESHSHCPLKNIFFHRQCKCLERTVSLGAEHDPIVG
jgi:hypothetical protein